MQGKVETLPGNSPVRDVPSDYYPAGHGFYFVLPAGLDAGKKMFYHDSIYGTGAPQSTIVFVHGNPENSYTFRKVIADIVRGRKRAIRVVAMDHIGFGLSDQASYEMVCKHHADNLLQLVRYLDLNTMTLVIHDWGGPIGIGALLHEPERVKNLVILNSTVFPMPDKGATYKNYPMKGLLAWSRYPFIVPDWFWGIHAAFSIFGKPAKPLALMTRYWIFALRTLIGFPDKDERAAQKVYREQFKSKANARSSKRLVRQSAVWGYGYKYMDPTLGELDTTAFYKMIQASITRLWGTNGRNVGVRAVLGRWDPLGKDDVIQQWIENLPQLEGHVRLFEDVSHFIEEFKHEEIAQAILEVVESD